MYCELCFSPTSSSLKFLSQNLVLFKSMYHKLEDDKNEEIFVMVSFRRVFIGAIFTFSDQRILRSNSDFAAAIWRQHSALLPLIKSNKATVLEYAFITTKGWRVGAVGSDFSRTKTG